MIQTRLTQGYVIDTSALIDIFREYPPDIFPKLWKDIEKMIKQKLMIAPKEVFNELQRIEDDLFKWAKKHQKMFYELDEEQLGEVKNILEKFPNLIDPNKEIPDADPFVISLAIGRKWTIVTSERHRTSSDAKPKIPDVCVNYDLKCLKPLGYFRKMGWKY